jgi:protein-tyrosine phosphatase
MTFCPGKKQIVSVTGGWNRDLVTDLDAIHAWGARMLVSLMQQQEFDAVKVAPLELLQNAEKLNIEWINIPILDGSVPDGTFWPQWRNIACRLRECVDRGDRIVFHCLGGLGRTGTMAACLLIETGFPPASAVAAVRAARPGAIENKTQEDFVLAYKPITGLQQSARPSGGSD